MTTLFSLLIADAARTPSAASCARCARRCTALRTRCAPKSTSSCCAPAPRPTDTSASVCSSRPSTPASRYTIPAGRRVPQCPATIVLLAPQIPTRVNLAQVCQQLAANQHFGGVVDLCLVVAERRDPHRRALQFYQTEVADDQVGLEALLARRDCYLQICQVLQQLLAMAASHPQSPSVPKSPGPLLASAAAQPSPYPPPYHLACLPYLACFNTVRVP